MLAAMLVLWWEEALVLWLVMMLGQVMEEE
jgi:hypothetical protein